MLEACWPLHPVVACLLGPISRRRFGQNQRSIFGFLNSSEPHGFQDFLNDTAAEESVRPGPALGLSARQPRAVHPRFSRRAPVGFGGGSAGTMRSHRRRRPTYTVA